MPTHIKNTNKYEWKEKVYRIAGVSDNVERVRWIGKNEVTLDQVVAHSGIKYKILFSFCRLNNKVGGIIKKKKKKKKRLVIERKVSSGLFLNPKKKKLYQVVWISWLSGALQACERNNWIKMLYSVS